MYWHISLSWFLLVHFKIQLPCWCNFLGFKTLLLFRDNFCWIWFLVDTCGKKKMLIDKEKISFVLRNIEYECVISKRLKKKKKSSILRFFFLFLWNWGIKIYFVLKFYFMMWFFSYHGTMTFLFFILLGTCVPGEYSINYVNNLTLTEIKCCWKTPRPK